jgi:hypothetical protein
MTFWDYEMECRNTLFGKGETMDACIAKVIKGERLPGSSLAKP